MPSSSSSDSQSRSRSRSPLRPIIMFVAVLLLLFVIFSWFKPPVQSTDIPSAAAKRTFDAVKEQKTGQQAPRQ